MTFKQKHKLNRKNGRKLLFIHFKDSDLEIYGPEECRCYHEALDRFERDIRTLARIQGYHSSEVWQHNIEEAKEKIYKLWEDYYGDLRETREDYIAEACQYSDD